MLKVAWLSVEEGFRKVELIEQGVSFRKIKFLTGADKGNELTLPPAGVPFRGFHPALFIQDEEPKVWRYKGRSLPLVDRTKFPNPGQAEALHRTNPMLDEDGELIPYVLQPHAVQIIDGILSGDHQLLIGHKGVGKTSVVLHIAACIGQPVIRVNFTGQVSINDMVGSLGFGPQGTTWTDGPVIAAMRTGSWLLLDEISFGDASVLSALFPILEKKPSICLKENTGEVVTAQPGFRVFATGNNINGDNDGQYVGTQALNAALLDRFAGHGRIVEVKAMTAKQERHMLKEVLPELPPRLAKKAANFAAKVRSEHLKSFSTRELINFCTKTMEYKDAVAAARLTFLPLVENGEIRKGIEAAIQAIFGNRIIVGRYLTPNGGNAEHGATKDASGRCSADVTDPAEVEAIAKAYRGNGGTLSFEQIERDPKYRLRESNGMNAYRVCKRYAAAKAPAAPAASEAAPSATTPTDAAVAGKDATTAPTPTGGGDGAK